MIKRHKITLYLYLLCFSISMVGSAHVFAQKSDSVYFNKNTKKSIRTPQIKTNIQSYRPMFGFIPYNSLLGTPSKPAPSGKSDKVLTVVKVYPNPVDDQINITLRLERETNLSIKIMDLLGNEVVTLLNERYPAGESTRNFNIPNRLNSGIYFLRIVAGAETSVKRISVL